MQESAKYVFPNDLIGDEINVIENLARGTKQGANNIYHLYRNGNKIEALIDCYVFQIMKDNLFIINDNFANTVYMTTFLINYDFYNRIKQNYQQNNILLRTATIANMTLFQRNHFLNSNQSYKEKEVLNPRFAKTIQFYNFLFNQRKSFMLHKETFYFFIKNVKFLIKYKFLVENLSSTDNANNINKLLIDCLILINNILIENINENKVTEKRYIKLPGLDILLEIAFLVLLYHNDLISNNIFMGIESKYQSFCYRNDKNSSFNMVIEATKILTNVLCLRNFLSKGKKGQGKEYELYKNQFHGNIDFKLMFLDLQYYPSDTEIKGGLPNINLFYDSPKINDLIKGIFDLLFGNWLKCKLFN